MPVIRIAEADDPRIREYRNVPDGDLMRRHGLFVAEGRLVVSRLLETTHALKSLLLNESAFAGLQHALIRVPHDVPVYVTGSRELTSIVGFDLHRGCLALAERPREQSVADVIAGRRLLLLLEGLTDADNVGGAYRNAAAFGVEAVVLSPSCCDPLYRKAIRTSMGSALCLPTARAAHWPAELSTVRSAGFEIVALTPAADAIDISSYVRPPDRALALLVGSEGPGLSAEAQTFCTARVRICMRPGIDSLNVATATGIALHRLALIP